MLNCEETSELLGDYLDGKVPFSMRMSMMVHMMMCGPCRRYLKQIQDVIRLVEKTRDAPQPPSKAHEDDLLQAFRDKHNPKR